MFFDKYNYFCRKIILMCPFLTEINIVKHFQYTCNKNLFNEQLELFSKL